MRARNVHRRAPGPLRRRRADLPYSHRPRLQDRPVHLLRPPQTPDVTPARVVRDTELKILIQEAYNANYRVHGARKIWRHLNRQGWTVARCTVERLMRELGITGAVREGPDADGVDRAP
ncbi:IS3 family transposase [Streptomyces sp. HK10]|uniref:IS3 family transposase n=1 Tax=Streptomyces sp. HK10 TaxID=3373255 RepID=UPI003748A216